MKELLSCPFCGGEAKLECDKSHDMSWSVDNATIECIQCDASSDVFWCNNANKDSCEQAIKTAADAWNKRV